MAGIVRSAIEIQNVLGYRAMHAEEAPMQFYTTAFDCTIIIFLSLVRWRTVFHCWKGEWLFSASIGENQEENASAVLRAEGLR